MNINSHPTGSALATNVQTDLVLLHGWGTDKRIWEPVLPILGRSFRLHTLDLPGYGSSGHEMFPSDIKDLARLLLPKLPEHASYLGWSLGGSIATWLAAHYPSRVSALVTVASNPCFVQKDYWDTAMPRRAFDQFVGRLNASPARCLRYFSALQAAGDKHAAAILTQLRELSGATSASAVSLSKGLEMLGSLDLRPEITRIQQPHLAILGANDLVVPHTVSKSLSLLHRDLEIWQLPDCGHVPQRSRPQTFAARVADFLLQQEAPPASGRKKQAVARSFGAATQYDEAAALQREAGDVLMGILPESPAERVLDLGCGSGHFTPKLVQKSGARHALGLDIAVGMLHRARQKEAQVDWLCGDAEQIPVADDSIDLIFSNLVIQWCENLSNLAFECARVLRPGGHMVLSTLGPATLWELRAAWRIVDQVTHVNRFVPPHRLRDAFSAAGLHIRFEKIDTWTRRVADVRTLGRELKQIGAHNTNAGRHRGLVGKQRWQRLAVAYDSLRDGEDMLPVSWQLVFLHIQKPGADNLTAPE